MSKTVAETNTHEKEKEAAKEKETKTALPEQEAARRDFMKVSLAAGIGACALGAPLCAAVQLVTTPIFAESADGKSYFITTVDSLTERPQKFAIVDDKKDAWMTLPDQKIGTLYVRKAGDEVQAFHALCPHAGCMVQVINKNPVTGEDDLLYSCPCHTAHFTLDGARIGDNASPRDMDTLEVQIEEGRVYVQFTNFSFGIAEKRVN